MPNCARCLENGKETPATHFARVWAYFSPVYNGWIRCENDGANVCKECLTYTLSLGKVKLNINELLQV